MKKIYVCIIMVLLLNCKKETHKEIISLNQNEKIFSNHNEEKYSRAENPAVFGFVIGKIQGIPFLPGQKIIIKQVGQGGWWTADTLKYPQYGLPYYYNSKRCYLHHPYTDGFGIEVPGGIGTFYNWCEPSNETQIFQGPASNNHGTNYWPLSHLESCQRVWHYTDNPLYPQGPERCWGLWCDFNPLANPSNQEP